VHLRAPPSGPPAVCGVVVTLPTVGGAGGLDVCPQHTQVERPLGPEGARERSAAFGKVKTRDRGVQVRSTARRRAPRIWRDHPGGRVAGHHETQQIGLW